MAFQKIWKSGDSMVVTVPPFIVQQLGTEQMWIDWMQIYEQHRGITVTAELDRVTEDGEHTK